MLQGLTRLRSLGFILTPESTVDGFRQGSGGAGFL